MWIGRSLLTYWRWQYHHPKFDAFVRGMGWVLVFLLWALAIFLAMAVPDKGLLCP